MAGIEAGAGAFDLGALELVQVGGEEDLGSVFEEEGTEEGGVLRVA